MRSWLFAAAALGCAYEPPTADMGAEPAKPVDAAPVEKALFDPNGNCSPLQQTNVQEQEALASVLIHRAQDFLAEIYIANDLGTRFTGSDPVFEGLFGPLNETTWAEVYDRYTGIEFAMATNVYSCHVDGDLVGVSSSGTQFICGTTAGLLAVSQDEGSSARLCPDFFSEPVPGSAGVLVHETSHQARSYFGGVGTDDLRDAVPNNAARIEIFVERFNCEAGTPRCPTIF